MADAEVTLPEISVVIPPDNPNSAGAGEGKSTDTSPDSLLNNDGGGAGSTGDGTGIGFGSGGGGNSGDIGGFGQGVNKNSNAYRIPTLEESRDILGGVAPNWRFIAIMPEIDKKVGSNLSVSDTGASYNSAKKLSGSNIPIAVCQSVTIPPVTIDTDQRFGAGTKIYVPRFVSTGMLTITFYEDENYSVSKYLWAWHLSVVNSDNLFYLPKDFKKDIKVWAFNNLSNTSPAMQTDFIECFPTISVNGLDYSVADNGFLTVSTDFTIDNQESHFT